MKVPAAGDNADVSRVAGTGMSCLLSSVIMRRPGDFVRSCQNAAQGIPQGVFRKQRKVTRAIDQLVDDNVGDIVCRLDVADNQNNP